jgi:hypothetical protein
MAQFFLYRRVTNTTAMKKMLNRGWRMILAFIIVSAMSLSSAKAQTSVSLQVFYDELQPYGTWMDYGSYGYVWIPRVASGFVPYATNGYWINTEYGNTWVSDYAWGWAPFHYGRWLFDDFYGWVWVPDTEWAPAWVTWRSGGGYYGWAPLMPGINMHMAFHYYDRLPRHYWSFVPCRYITYRNVYAHCVSRPRVVNVYNHTTIVNNYYTDSRKRTYFSGPSRSDIERRGGGRVTTHHIDDSSRPEQTIVTRNTAKFYRPDIDNTQGSRSRPTPSHFVRKDGAGKLVEVQRRTERGKELSTPVRSDFQRETSTREAEKIIDRSERQTTQTDRYRNQRDFQPAERMAEPTRETRSRTYEPLPQQDRRMTRDQYDAPPIEKTRTREFQRRTYEQPQPQLERRQPIMRQRENVNRSQPSLDQRRTRSTMGQQSQQPRQIERSSHGQSKPRAIRSSDGGQVEFKKRH